VGSYWEKMYRGLQKYYNHHEIHQMTLSKRKMTAGKSLSPAQKNQKTVLSFPHLQPNQS